ncbi:MAG: hypothetical protein CO119_00180 [Flavobacteriales bacterium CG_4_9_14_3_um_filter_40_17]|nr:MAG: hypothetical protein CO119_00180 [Flavobacteriales bacterium CG_4_9_14_3_um_filter_40_17]
MTNRKQIWFRLFSVFGFVILFLSCSQEFSEIGTDIVGGNNFEVGRFSETFVKAYNKRISPAIETSNLPAHLLGVSNDPVYGKLKANVAVQLALNQVDPKFGVNPEIKNVILNVPYFSTRTEITTEGESIYRLDSIFGDKPYKLSVYENKFFLSALDPNEDFQASIPIYSDKHDELFGQVGPLLFSEDAFVPSNKEILVFPETGDPAVDTIPNQRLAPQLRVELDKDFFKTKILDKEGSEELSNLNNFQNFFRGLYFVAEPTNPNETGMLLIDFNRANIQMNYTFDQTRTVTNPDGTTSEVTERADATLTFLMGGVKANTFVQEFNPAVETIVQNANLVQGDERLYVKGGAGSMAVVELFGPDEDGNGEADQLTEIKKNDWLVNEANLVFYIDQQTTQLSIEPTRIFIYDLKNNIPIADFTNDPIIVNNVFQSRTTFGGIIEKDANGKGIKYKIRLTDHIKNIIRKDSINVPLGVVVTNNVTVLGNSRIKNAAADATIKNIPRFTAFNPLGTVLFGNNTSQENENKKLKLEIIFTKPDN